MRYAVHVATLHKNPVDGKLLLLLLLLLLTMMVLTANTTVSLFVGIRSYLQEV
jgi:hypothetical protein